MNRMIAIIQNQLRIVESYVDLGLTAHCRVRLLVFTR
jgi:hypothetical protein